MIFRESNMQNLVAFSRNISSLLKNNKLLKMSLSSKLYQLYKKAFGHSQDRKSRGRGSPEVGQLPSGIFFGLLNVQGLNNGCSTRH